MTQQTHGANSVLLGGSERPLRAGGIDLEGLDLEGRWSDFFEI